MKEINDTAFLIGVALVIVRILYLKERNQIESNMKILTIIALVFASVGEYSQAGSICHCCCEQNGRMILPGGIFARQAILGY